MLLSRSKPGNPASSLYRPIHPVGLQHVVGSLQLCFCDNCCTVYGPTALRTTSTLPAPILGKRTIVEINVRTFYLQFKFQNATDHLRVTLGYLQLLYNSKNKQRHTQRRYTHPTSELKEPS